MESLRCPPGPAWGSKATCFLPGCGSSSWSGEPPSTPHSSDKLLWKPRKLWGVRCLGEGGGPGGCLPGITRPTAVPTAGAGAWLCAWKPGSRDERLGRASAKSLKPMAGTSCYRLLQLLKQGWNSGRAGLAVSLLGHGTAHPSPGSPRSLWANSIPSTVQNNLFQTEVRLCIHTPPMAPTFFTTKSQQLTVVRKPARTRLWPALQNCPSSCPSPLCSICSSFSSHLTIS